MPGLAPRGVVEDRTGVANAAGHRRRGEVERRAGENVDLVGREGLVVEACHLAQSVPSADLVEGGRRTVEDPGGDRSEETVSEPAEGTTSGSEPGPERG